MKEKMIQFIEDGFCDFEGCGAYPKSFHKQGGSFCFAADFGDRDVLIASVGFPFTGEQFTAAGEEWVLAEQTHENAVALRQVFPFTAPIPVLRKDRTVGVGDRLGIATPGHIRVFEEYDAFPVFAQQSIRELNLTHRSFDDVLDCVSFAVFRENYTKGFGADGDHVKTPDEVEYAIRSGYTMITLDCSEHIHNEYQNMPLDEVRAVYIPNPQLEATYLNRTFSVGNSLIAFGEEAFQRMTLIYDEAIDFAVSIYHRYFAGSDRQIDFEISIDETATPTTPAQHFYVASELIARGVRPATVAPRFTGEFQKGIDYIGNLADFDADMKIHAAIAKHFDYKISVHSGSDKFSVFSSVGKYTEGRFHLKTAGTNWLEAMKIVAAHRPSLYRDIHQYALESAFAEARKYYHVTTNLDNIPALSSLSDEQLPTLFENNDARQLIHITYGLILTNPRFREPLFETWRTCREEYAEALLQHIGRHLELLYQGFAD